MKSPMNLLEMTSIQDKLANVDLECHSLLSGELSTNIPAQPGRDIEIKEPKDLPPKLGLQSEMGQARLLHDLANIELQAMELGVRTLHEFPGAPTKFRKELSEIVLDEARHLRMCIEGIESLGFKWGSWPIHLLLWNTVSSDNSLLERVFIVHRYLEGSGLDSGDAILRKLSGIKGSIVTPIVKTISDEEVAHVQFGNKWFVKLCQDIGVNSEEYSNVLFKKFGQTLPARGAKVSHTKREAAGFSNVEVKDLEQFMRLKNAKQI